MQFDSSLLAGDEMSVSKAQTSTSSTATEQKEPAKQVARSKPRKFKPPSRVSKPVRSSPENVWSAPRQSPQTSSESKSEASSEAKSETKVVEGAYSVTSDELDDVWGSNKKRPLSSESSADGKRQRLDEEPEYNRSETEDLFSGGSVERKEEEDEGEGRNDSETSSLFG